MTKFVQYDKINVEKSRLWRFIKNMDTFLGKAMYANYHTHTKRCNHATGDEREYIENAISRGLSVLGFSDHCPQFFPTDEYYSHFRMRPEAAAEYVETISKLKDEYKDRIEIKIGFEAEYYPETFEEFIKFAEKLNIDFLTLGQHYIDNEYDTNIPAHRMHENEQELVTYVDAVITAIKTGKFTYVAHPDIFLFDTSSPSYKKHFTRLCEAAKAYDIPLELNLLGIRKERSYPSEEFFRIASLIGNKIIIGCDAHAPEDVASEKDVEKAYEFAQQLNLNLIKKVNLRKI